jgi:hypothetical protein
MRAPGARAGLVRRRGARPLLGWGRAGCCSWRVSFRRRSEHVGKVSVQTSRKARKQICLAPYRPTVPLISTSSRAEKTQ